MHASKTPSQSPTPVDTSMPTLPDYPGVFRIRTESPALPYESRISRIKHIKVNKMHRSGTFWPTLGIFEKTGLIFDEI